MYNFNQTNNRVGYRKEGILENVKAISPGDASGYLSEDAKVFALKSVFNGILRIKFADRELHAHRIDVSELPFKPRRTGKVMEALTEEFSLEGWVMTTKGTEQNFYIEFSRRK